MSPSRIVKVTAALGVSLFVASVEVHYSPVRLAISPALAVAAAWVTSAWISGGLGRVGARDLAGLALGSVVAYLLSPLLGSALGAAAGLRLWPRVERAAGAGPSSSGEETTGSAQPPLPPKGPESVLVVGPDIRSAARVAFRLAATAAALPLRVVVVDTVGVAREEFDEVGSAYTEVGPEDLDLMSPTAPPEHYVKAAWLVSAACGGNASSIEAALRNRTLDALARNLTTPQDLRVLAGSFSGGVRVSVIDAMPRFGALLVDLSGVEPTSAREVAALLAAMQSLSTDHPSFLVATALSSSVSRDSDRRLRAEVGDLLTRLAGRGVVLAVDSAADARFWDVFPVLVLCPGLRASWQSQILGSLRQLDGESIRELKRLREDEVLVVWGSPTRRARVRLRDLSPRASSRE